MEKLPEGWKISERDGGDRFIDSPTTPLTEKEKEIMKKEIIENHKDLGLPENLKKELYPELFK